MNPILSVARAALIAAGIEPAGVDETIARSTKGLGGDLLSCVGALERLTEEKHRLALGPILPLVDTLWHCTVGLIIHEPIGSAAELLAVAAYLPWTPHKTAADLQKEITG